MLAIIVVVILSFLALFSYKCSHSWTHPAFLTSMLWLIMVLCYNVLQHGLYPLSDLFYCALLLWCIPFCVCSLAFSKFNLPIPKILLWQMPNMKIFQKLSLLLVLLNVILLCFLNTISKDYGDNIMSGSRNMFIYHEDELPALLNYLMYFLNVSVVFIISYMYTYGAKPISFKLLFVAVLIVLLCLGNKGGIACSVFAVLFLQYYYGKLTFSRMIICLLLLVGVMTILVLVRGDAEDVTLTEYLLIYILSPMPAFDLILKGDLSFNVTPGAATFSSIVKVLDVMGLGDNIKHLDASGWAYVPLPTNVYTNMFNYYVDFGYWGIFLFAILVGIAWGTLYNFMRRGVKLFVAIYALFFHALLLAFFADWIFTFLSLSIQYLFISHLLFIRFKIKYE